MAKKFGFGRTIRLLKWAIALFNKFYNSLCGVDLVGR